MTKTNKKQLLDETKQVKKFLQPFLSASNVQFPLKEKTNNFFDKLMKFLDDNTEEDDVDDKFNNQPTTIKHNLEYLIKKFTKEPVELENRKELEENKEVKTVLNKLYENEIKDKLKKSEKETS